MTADSAKASCSLWVAIDHSEVFLRVVGRASFAISPSLKQFGDAIVNHPCKRFVLDMAECESADSTFLGILAGLSMRLKKSAGVPMIMVNLSSKIYEAVSLLGLNRIIECYPAGMCPAELQEKLQRVDQLERIEIEQAEKRVAAETILEAHTDLARLDERNHSKFKDLLSLLQNDLKKKEH